MEVRRILIIGAGQMGRGIAQVMAQNGLEVVIGDIKQEFVQLGIIEIENTLAKSVAKGKITSKEKTGIMSRISGVVELDTNSCNVDLVLEAAVENIEVKKELFQTIDKLTPERTILASNTSSLPITALAALTNRPAGLLGCIFQSRTRHETGGNYKRFGYK